MPALDLERCRWALNHFFASQEDVLLAYLIGCRGEDQAGRVREVDFGILLAPQVDPEGFFAARLRLASDLICLLRFPEVDVSVLNEAPLALRYMALRRSYLLYCRQRQALASFRARTVHEYCALQPYLEGYSRPQPPANCQETLDWQALRKAFDQFCLSRPPFDENPFSYS